MAKWLGWVDNSMNRRPSAGIRSVESVVSHAAPTRAALAVGAYDMAARAEGVLNTSSRVRTGESYISVEHRDLDYIVLLNEGPNGKGGSAGIEMKHHPLARAIESMGA